MHASACLLQHRLTLPGPASYMACLLELLMLLLIVYLPVLATLAQPIANMMLQL